MHTFAQPADGAVDQDQEQKHGDLTVGLFFLADDSPPVAAVEPARLRSRTQSSQPLDQDRIYLQTLHNCLHATHPVKCRSPRFA